jgi:hypothetical protein
MNNTTLNPHLRQANVIDSAFCPRDLMTGNLVNRKYYNPHPTNPSWELTKCKVVAVRENNSLTVKDKDKSHMVIDYWEAIPITKDLIERFGFEKRVTVGHSIQYFIGINTITNDWLFDILWQDSQEFPFYRNGFFKIKYVHRLQNLFSCLTGQELVLS